MQLPDAGRMIDAVVARLRQPLRVPPMLRPVGVVTEVGPTCLTARIAGIEIGELCAIGRHGLLGEVVLVQEEAAVLSVYGQPEGVRCGDLIVPSGRPLTIGVGDFLIGNLVDGLGRLLDAGASAGAITPKPAEFRPLLAPPPSPMSRRLIGEAMPLGIRAIDGLLTCGRGQRVGVFAAAGVGKSTLLGMCMDRTLADVTVLALVGERGREVREFVEQTMTPEARARAVIVVATSDRPAAERLKCVYTATTIAEYFRDQGRNVLLMIDSLTRFARAAREIGLAAGEPPVARGYPPSVFARMPGLLERAGQSASGSITGIYTVLVEGNDMDEPVADEIRSILDGHIVLSRRLAEAGHFPAIDIAASISRVMPQVATRAHLDHAAKVRQLLASYAQVEFLVRVGEYKAGEDALADAAIEARPAITRFLQQRFAERSDFDTTMADLRRIAEVAC